LAYSKGDHITDIGSFCLFARAVISNLLYLQCKGKNVWTRIALMRQTSSLWYTGL